LIARSARGLAAAYRVGELRLHARVRRLAQDADHVLSHLTVPSEPLRLSPRPVPKILGPGSAILNVFFSSDSWSPCHGISSSPSLSGRYSVVVANMPICRHFAEATRSWTVARLCREVLYGAGADNRTSRFTGTSWRISPLTDSNRRPPPFHGGFALREGDGGTALACRISLLLTYFRCRPHSSLDEP
jgi:hypothetical protein